MDSMLENTAEGQHVIYRNIAVFVYIIHFIHPYSFKIIYILG